MVSATTNSSVGYGSSASLRHMKCWRMSLMGHSRRLWPVWPASALPRSPPDAALRARNSASRYVIIHEPLARIDMLGKDVSILPKPDGVFRSPSALQRPFDDIDIQTGRNSASQECYRLIIRCDAPRSPAHDEPRRVEKRAQVVFVLVAA